MIYPDSTKSVTLFISFYVLMTLIIIGLTNNLMKRFSEHKEGKYATCYTFIRRPVRLVYFETIPFLKEAIERETQLKKWSRKKKEALIRQDYHKLHLLAECQNLSHFRYKDAK